MKLNRKATWLLLLGACLLLQGIFPIIKFSLSGMEVVLGLLAIAAGMMISLNQ